MNAIEQAQAKRERKANRPNPTRYAAYNVTSEAQEEREKINRKIEADRAAREARAIQKEQDRRALEAPVPGVDEVADDAEVELIEPGSVEAQIQDAVENHEHDGCCGHDH